MDPWRSNIGGGPDLCDPCGVDAYDDTCNFISSVDEVTQSCYYQMRFLGS